MRFFHYLLPIIFSIVPARAEERVPWTSSKVHGSPEKPRPYVAEKIWPDLVFDRVCDIARLPSRKTIFLTEQKGKIWMLPDDIESPAPQPVLFVNLKESLEEFESSYSIAFHPDFETNGEVFVFYRIAAKQVEDATHISRFRVYKDRFELDPTSEEMIITFRSGGHNGGHISFGPDGMLYILSGDSEIPTPPDPINTGQDISDLLSCVIRIDVDKRDPGKAYHVPEDNPFLKIKNARPEVWAYGLRNPWKMSFHPQSGDLWVGDVGWDMWEMLNRVERGFNFGWSIMEGPQPTKINQNPGPSPISPPTVIHPHSEMGSITAGYVSETDRLPALKNVLLYGDYETGQLWGLHFDEKGKELVSKEYLADTRLRIVSFGQAAKGEVIFADYSGEANLYRLIPNLAKNESKKFPRKLSETGIFSDVKNQTPQPGVYDFSINASLWRDGATAQRWIGIPGSGTIEFPERGPFSKIPDGTVLAKTLSLEGRKIETQILHYEDKVWQGYSYQWDSEQNDAALVDAAGKTETILGKPWTFQSRATCARCHNVGSDYRLAFHPGLLNRNDQLKRFQELGLVNEEFVANAEEQPSADVHDETAAINLRARTWLAVNCAHCHRYRGGSSVSFSLNLKPAADKLDLINAPPLRGNFGIPDGKLIAPGAPFHSILYYRVATAGMGHMPLIGSKSVDPLGEKLLHDWVVSLGEKKSQNPGSVSEALQQKHDILAGKITGKERDKIISDAEKSDNLLIQELFIYLAK